MAAAAAVIARKEREIVNIFRGAGATSPERARSPEELDVPRRVAFRRLVSRAVLREAGDERFYLDEPSWEALRRLRRRLAITLLLIILAILLALFFTGTVTFGGRSA